MGAQDRPAATEQLQRIGEQPSELPTSAPHSILLTYHRELRFDRVGKVVRVAYYIPKAERAELRQLAVRSQRGDVAAITALRELERERHTAQATSLALALARAKGKDTPDAECYEVERFAAYCGWLDDEAVQ